MKTNFFYALRNIRKNAGNSVITVVGLAVAIACFLIIYFFVSQEYTYNSFHKKADKIYRINYHIQYFNASYKEVRVEPEVAELLKKQIPQIEKSTEYRFAFEQVLGFKNIFYDVNVGLAGEDFFEIFSFKLLAGSSSKVFKNPHEIVITRKIADKFGIKNYETLLGKTIDFPLAYKNIPFKIVGIIENIPENSSIDFDVVVSGKSGRNFGGCDNYFGYTSVFYLVKDKVNTNEVERNVSNLLNQYYKDRIERMQKENKLVKNSSSFVPFVLPLKEVYLAGDVDNCFEKSIDKNIFFILLTITSLILIIACSNYTILSLGQYLKKVGDVGVRKAMGAQVKDIFIVFLCEGFILTSVAFLLGAMLCSFLIPVFNILAQKEILTELINIPKAIFFITALFFGISIITSFVPVLVFSKVSPRQMAGKKITVGNKSNLSHIFVSLQYSLSIILIIVTLFIIRQSNFMKNYSLGFDSKNIIDIRIEKLDDTEKKEFKELLAKCPGVISQTIACRNFMNGSSDDYVNRGDGERIDVFKFKVDENYIPTLNLKLIQGNNFTQNNVKTGDKAIIVNKKFTEAFGIEDEPIGRTYNISGGYFTIIGVVEDYHFFDLRHRIYPAMLHSRINYGNDYNTLLVKYHPEQLPLVIKTIKKSYETIAPGKTLSYSFWSEKLSQRYEMEERWSKVIGYASIIAIIISSLGLFGLTVLLINQQVKEIGIRKVNGANALEVLLTINKTFIGWLIGSLIIAIPVSYFVVIKWLENFPYKVEVSWWIFVLAGFMAFLAAILTVTWQSYRAATRNPVEALRYE